MDQFNRSGPGTSSELEDRQTVCTVPSVQEIIAALEENLSGAANTTRNHTPVRDCEKRFMSALAQNGKAETRESIVPSCPEVYQNTKLSVEQQNSGKAPKLPERQKPLRACGTQNKAQRECAGPSLPKRSLADVLALGNHPLKPSRPPSVDIDRFRRNGPRMKILHPVATPPLRSCPLSNQMAALSLQVDEDDIYDDVDVMNPPSLPSKEHPSKRTAEPKGIVNSEEMKGQDMKTKEQDRKQQKAEEKREAKKKLKSKPQRGRGRSGWSLNQREITEVFHSMDKHDKTEPVHTCRDALKEEESDTDSDIYDDIGAPADVCSGLTWQNLRGDYVNPGIRVSSLPQPAVDGGDVHGYVDSQSPPLATDGYHIYGDIEDDCIYEID